MMSLARLLHNRRGNAAVEMALVTPLLLIILFGSVELGNYFMNEHILIKGVRDGARYAARQNFAQYFGCSNSAASVPTSVSDNTKLLVRTGTLNPAANDLLPNWGSPQVAFTVTMTCSTSVGGTALGGIYVGNSVGAPGLAPAVLITASLPYQPILSSFGFSGLNTSLNASQQAAVAGL